MANITKHSSLLILKQVPISNLKNMKPYVHHLNLKPHFPSHIFPHFLSNQTSRHTVRTDKVTEAFKMNNLISFSFRYKHSIYFVLERRNKILTPTKHAHSLFATKRYKIANITKHSSHF